MRRPRVALKPQVVDLESRAVPTVVSPLAFGRQGAYATQVAAGANARLGAVAMPAGSTSPGASSGADAGLPSGIPFSPNPTIAPSETTPDGTPLTPIGAVRARFVATGSGPFALGRSSFPNVAHDITYIGKFGSNQLLRGTYVMRIVVPTDPTAQTFGVLQLRDLSNATTGTVIVLDQTITAFDQAGRPTASTWVIDSSSGGAYATAIGQGTMTITYTRNGHSRNSAGGAILSIRGQVLPTGNGSNVNFDIPKFN
jgi:hypothetical protein